MSRYDELKAQTEKLGKELLKLRAVVYNLTTTGGSMSVKDGGLRETNIRARYGIGPIDGTHFSRWELPAHIAESVANMLLVEAQAVAQQYEAAKAKLDAVEELLS